MSFEQIKYAKSVSLKTIVDDGFKQIQMKDSNCQGFEYTVGKVCGGKLKVVFEPDQKIYNSAEIDGVDGFGFIMAFEDPK